MYRRLHEEFGLRVQLNLFYRTEGFELSEMSDAYYDEWCENADWLKLSFHSELESFRPYESAGYCEVYEDCKRVNEQIKRFASPAALASTTTIHYCLLTDGGLKAIRDIGVGGLLGLFGTPEEPRTSYGIGESDAGKIRDGDTIKVGQISFASIDIVLNSFTTERIIEKLSGLTDRECIRVMIHEQYFYDDYPRYQPEFEEKLRSTFAFLCNNGYQSGFYESLIT